MAEDIAISVNDVSKMYKLYDNPWTVLKSLWDYPEKEI